MIGNFETANYGLRLKRLGVNRPPVLVITPSFIRSLCERNCRYRIPQPFPARGCREDSDFRFNRPTKNERREPTLVGASQSRPSPP